MEEFDYALDNFCCAVGFMASRNGEQLHIGRVHPFTTSSCAGCPRLQLDKWAASSNLTEIIFGEGQGLCAWSSPVSIPIPFCSNNPQVISQAKIIKLISMNPGRKKRECKPLRSLSFAE
jgi:hypothetical protein